MDWFDDPFESPFEEIVREFFGDRPSRKRRQAYIKGEDETNSVDFIEDDKHVYFIFELPGYEGGDVAVIVKENTLEVNASKKSPDNVQPYLAQKLEQGLRIRKRIPSFVKTKNFEHSMKNGILEVRFKK